MPYGEALRRAPAHRNAACARSVARGARASRQRSAGTPHATIANGTEVHDRSLHEHVEHRRRQEGADEVEHEEHEHRGDAALSKAWRKRTMHDRHDDGLEQLCSVRELRDGREKPRREHATQALAHRALREREEQEHRDARAEERAIRGEVRDLDDA